MCPLRRVEGHLAGPAALGLLLPPGRQTFLILRPRSLAFDLLLLETAGSTAFQQLSALDAPGLAQKVYYALQQEPIETLAQTEGSGTRLYIRIGPFALVACPRCPGQAYQPQVFADPLAAQEVGQALAIILRPPANVEQEIYFNIRHFT